MSRATRILALAAATHTGSAAAQRPDFSGVWAVVAAPVAAPTSDPRAPSGGMGAPFRVGDMGSGWGTQLTIAQSPQRLTVTFPFFSDYDLQPPLSFTFALDGTESRNVVMMGRGMQDQRSRVSMPGDSLVVTTLHAFPSPVNGQPMSVEVRQALVLASRDTLVIRTTRAGVLGGPTTSTTTRYVRK